MLAMTTQNGRRVGSAGRLRCLADTLVELGRLKLPEFISEMTRMVLDGRGRQLRKIEKMLGRQAEYPKYWRSDLETYRCMIRESIVRPECALPSEYHGMSVSDGFAAVQQFIGQFGALMVAWPAVWTEAKAKSESAPYPEM